MTNSRRVSRYFSTGWEVPLESGTNLEERKHQEWMVSLSPILKNLKHKHQLFQIAHFPVVPQMFFRHQNPQTSTAQSSLFWLDPGVITSDACLQYCWLPCFPIHLLQFAQQNLNPQPIPSMFSSSTQAVEWQLEKSYNSMGLFLLKIVFLLKIE